MAASSLASPGWNVRIIVVTPRTGGRPARRQPGPAQASIADDRGRACVRTGRFRPGRRNSTGTSKLVWQDRRRGDRREEASRPAAEIYDTRERGQPGFEGGQCRTDSGTAARHSGDGAILSSPRRAGEGPHQFRDRFQRIRQPRATVSAFGGFSPFKTASVAASRYLSVTASAFVLSSIAPM